MLAQKNIILLMGPTATGKTQLAIDICSTLPCEIISVDSAMVYRGMDIGTGKPSVEILRKIPHHLINIREPADYYSAGDFRVDAERLIAEIHAQGRTPILAGGTMMYFNILLRGLADLPRADFALREKLTARIANEGLANLHAELKEIDPIAAEKINPNDAQRIQRALEVFLISGETLTALQQKSTAPLANCNPFLFALNYPDRTILHAKIAERFHAMLIAGFIDEVQHLKNNPANLATSPALRSIGYAQIWQYLENKLSQTEMIEQSIAATRQLAKRQLTWLRRFENLTWLDAQENNCAHIDLIRKLMLV